MRCASIQIWKWVFKDEDIHFAGGQWWTLSESTKGLMVVDQTVSHPAKSTLTPSNWTFCSYMIPDDMI